MQCIRFNSRLISSLVTKPTNVRSISTSLCRRDTFIIKDEEEFKEKVLKSDIPVIVDFHASWCGPCKLLGPRIEKVINNYEGKVHLAKVDIDENQELALEYGVSAVPSVIAVGDAKAINKFVGLQEEARIDSFIKGVLKKP